MGNVVGQRGSAKMRTGRLVGMMFLAGCAATGEHIAPAQAQTAADKRFTLTNHTSGPIRDFRLQAPGKSWSGNWLNTPIPARGYRNLAFNAARPSACVMTAQVIIDFGSRGRPDEKVIEQRVNFCGLAQIHVLNDRLRLEWDSDAPPAPRYERDPHWRRGAAPADGPSQPADWGRGR